MSNRVSKSGREGRNRKNKSGKSKSLLYAGLAIVAIIVVSTVGAYFFGQHNTPAATTTTPVTSSEPIILYVNQGNGLVGQNNFSALLSFAKSCNFNTIFFQIYRSGKLLFSTDALRYYIAAAHVQNLKIFFALYFTNSTQQIPTSIYGLGEDGISLDMSSLNYQTQSALLSTLQENYNEGKTAVTTTDFTTSLHPNMLILETYSTADQKYIHKGMITGVEALATSSKQDYEAQFQFALANSDGVMVFDYYGLLTRGY